ncbi:hypothetical protein [Gordonia liuliyuniae]|uniref:Excreted virulence factor EspC, type VII ESX diderm n=1 Tax=Gordonia liuliyuniae TaxID=2911517 RepID=A0ABS9IXM4_9ACTN|nr:hypothetical protein [Gordonia liuliyuniae]MCF8590261.1 hypothetical protein [Gordonia liuliyuniae]
MSNDVASEIAAWNARAAAARAAGVELEALSDSLRGVVSTNYFGVGCQEGFAVFAQLRLLVDHGTQSLSTLAASAESLADAALAADRNLRGTDSANAPANGQPNGS